MTTLLKSFNLLQKKMKNIMIVGGSRIAFHLAHELSKDKVNVKIIEQDASCCNIFAEALDNVEIIQGDASLHETLEKENIEETDALISLTGIDELNTMLSIYGSNIHLPMVVTKLGRAENLDVLMQLPIGSMVLPKELCANTIIRYVRAMKCKSTAAISIHGIAHGRAEAIEFIVDQDTRHLNESFKSIPFKKNILVTSISRNNKVIYPTGDTHLEIGDRVIVVAKAEEALQNINDMFKERSYEL